MEVQSYGDGQIVSFGCKNNHDESLENNEQLSLATQHGYPKYLHVCSEPSDHQLASWESVKTVRDFHHPAHGRVQRAGEL